MERKEITMPRVRMSEAEEQMHLPGKKK
jgi:hypothetical protein